MFSKKIVIICLLIAISGLAYFMYPSFFPKSTKDSSTVILSEVLPRTFNVEVQTVGELEAAKSIIVASSIRGELGKVIYLIPDGANVQPNDVLVKMDPSPFEERISELSAKISDQKASIYNLEQALKWEHTQAESERKAAEFEIESAKLELDKIVNGDGPLELYRLESAMLKAQSKYDELNAYSDDLAMMEQEGYINHSERKQAEKKLKEEQENLDNARMQYDTYKERVHPMLVKKAETVLRKSELRIEEVSKSNEYKIEKAIATLGQAKQVLRDLEAMLRGAEIELAQSEIKAPAQGMVVLREEYRTGQKRKPRVGDILVKNQPLLDLPDLSTMIVKTKVREVELYKVAVGKPAIVEVDAYPQTYFHGKVQSIGILAISDITRVGNEKYFEVKVMLDNSDARLRPGMTARVAIDSAHVENALAVPLPAIFRKDKQTCCYVKEGNHYRIQPVELGSCNDMWAEIKDGLKYGDNVCLTSPSAEEIAMDSSHASE